MSAMSLRWYHCTIAGVLLVTVGIALIGIPGLGLVAVAVMIAGCVLNLVAVVKAMQEGERPGEPGS